MHIENIASYKFIALNELPTLRAQLLALCEALQLKGTILLSEEGINLTLAGTPTNMAAFKTELTADPRFADLVFKISYSGFQPFKRLKVKLKKEIITLRNPSVRPLESRAPSISPAELKQWLDERRDITLLDTRNDYEVEAGTFSGAVNLHLNDFCEFAKTTNKIQRDKPVVMFCTGGIRCEKAALHLLNEGFSDVYQLDGGILNYFEKVGGVHYDGACFVFDERVALDSNLIAQKQITT